MEERKPFIPFLIGLFFGWVGVRVMVHFVYCGIILTLITLLILKK
jgi:Kef-type K+ transport system membrane component KefB